MGGTVFKMTSLKVLLLSAALLSVVAWQPAQAGTASADPTLVVAGGGAANADPDAIPPMPSSALQGAWCAGGAVASLAAAYAIGPSEIVMMVSGAMHVPSSGPLLFIPLYSILAGGSCALAAAAQPAIGWAAEQSTNIAEKVGEQVVAVGDSLLGRQKQYADAAANDANKGASIRPMSSGEQQSAGCLTGAVGGFLGSMASSPMEIVMLSAGGITVASSTPILAMGLLGTIVASGCAIGNYALLPIVALFNSFSGGSGGGNGQALNHTDVVGSKLAEAATALGGVVGRSLTAAGQTAGVQFADGNVVMH